MRDHGLFQAICRVNRLDGDDKDYGYIIDYKDLFRSLESAVKITHRARWKAMTKKMSRACLKDRLRRVASV